MIECSKCREEKYESEFNKKGKRKDGSYKLQPYCKDCQKIVIRAYYQANKNKVKKQVAEKKSFYIGRIHKAVCRYLEKNPCVKCGEPDITCLEFHHLKDKEANLADLIRGGNKWETLEKEICKCIVLCASCHRKETAALTNNYKYQYKYGSMM